MSAVGVAVKLLVHEAAAEDLPERITSEEHVPRISYAGFTAGGGVTINESAEIAAFYGNVSSRKSKDHQNRKQRSLCGILLIDRTDLRQKQNKNTGDGAEECTSALAVHQRICNKQRCRSEHELVPASLEQIRNADENSHAEGVGVFVPVYICAVEDHGAVSCNT